MKVPREIRTKRFVLRRHRAEDLDAFAAFLADPDAVRYMAFTQDQKTREGADQMLRWVIGAYDSDEPVFSLTIAGADGRGYLGSCGLHPDPAGGVEIYYTVIPSEQGKGIATEAAAALVDFATAEPGIRRITAFVVPENVPSVRVAEKLGFRDDGPVSRGEGEAGVDHAALKGRRYVLDAPA